MAVKRAGEDRPSRKELQALWDHCLQFITDQQILCPESVCQTDRVILNAYTFIEGVCDIVGYAADEYENE